MLNTENSKQPTKDGDRLAAIMSSDAVAKMCKGDYRVGPGSESGDRHR